VLRWRHNENMPSSQPSDRLAVPVGAQDHTRGPDGAPVTLVEYGDFECPFCGRAYPAVERLIREYGDRLRFVFRHFPRPEHPHARHAAEAAAAAGLQSEDGFWRVYHSLFAHQDALDDASLARYAAEAGLDVERWSRDMHSEPVMERVQHDIQSAIHSGGHGTPTFFINGRKHEGPDTFEDLRASIDAALGTRQADSDQVTEASQESFPASDPPAWIREQL
jgi:formate-nitrite transporter family protein